MSSLNRELGEIEPEAVLEAGDLDCGSGLVLLLRESMAELGDGGVLEMRSREPTVRDELPPWCGMVGHEYLGELPGDGCIRHFIRRGSGTAAAAQKRALEDDKERAKAYEWRARVRHSGHLKATVYCRNFAFDVGQAASFEERDTHPSAVEYVLGALGGSLTVAFATECTRRSLEVDDIELTVRGTLHNILAHLGLEQGDPSFESIEVRCYASTFDDEAEVRAAWSSTAERSPVLATLGKCVHLRTRLNIV
jgi:hypothetical protein